VVSDAGPLIHLAQIDKLHLLRRLFDHVSIVSEVKREAFDEGIRLGYADAKAIGKALDEGWLRVEDTPRSAASATRKLVKDENISLTDAKTLILARTSNAEILVDEKALSDLARMFGLKIWSTWTILLESLSRKIIKIEDIESAITELGARRHKLRDKHAVEILKAARAIASRKQTDRESTN
jgi:predicted nucleic acid-binding protein